MVGELIEAKVTGTSNHIVAKHQDLVAEAKYSLSSSAIKAISIIISMIRTTDEDFKMYKLSFSHFKELIGSSSNEVARYADKITNELQGKPFTIGDKKYTWAIKSQYKENQNHIKIQIHPDLKPYLLNLKKNGKFLQYDIINILPIKSEYVIRLYEYCKDQYEKKIRFSSQKFVEFTLKVETMRSLFEIPQSYQYSAGIKKRILERAILDFRKMTDIKMSYIESKKSGKKVIEITIRIEENNEGSNNFLRTEKSFISYMRKEYEFIVLLQARDEDNGGLVRQIAINKRGELYDASDGNYTMMPDKSKKLWEKLYDLALHGKLECLKTDKKRIDSLF